MADEDTKEPEGTPSKLVELPPGKALSLAGAARITRRSQAKVIVLAGEHDSGKTTLLASLYQRFVRGPFGGYMFAGSETLPAFEDRCHLARIASGQQTADMARTHRDEEAHVYHLKIRSEELKTVPRELLFLDLAGEHYENAMNDSSEARRLQFLLRAEHVVMLVDGEKLAVTSSRNLAIQRIKTLLRRLVEEKMIGKWTSLQILTAKWDVISISTNKQIIEDALESLEKHVARELLPKLNFAQLFPVAASPLQKPDLGLAYGLDPLVSLWSEQTGGQIPSNLRPTEAPDREIDRLSTS